MFDRGPRRQIFAERNQRHEHRTGQYVDDKQRPEAIGDAEQRISDHAATGGNHDDFLVGAGPVCEMGDKRIGEGANPNPDRQDQADLCCVEPAVLKPGRPERQVNADRQEDRRIIK